MRQERALRGAREALGDQSAPDLTFAVRLAVGHSFQAAGMLQEARAAYDKILKSSDVPQVQFDCLMRARRGQTLPET